MSDKEDAFTGARDAFIAEWGAMGSSWGINRTMAQVHALLFTSEDPLSTDEVMAELRISRGNANTTLRELVGWGLARSVIRKGERKEYFEAEKDVWRMFCIIARERKRREADPAVETLQRCLNAVSGHRSAQAATFRSQLESVLELMQLGGRVLERITSGERDRMMKLALKVLGAGGNRP